MNIHTTSEGITLSKKLESDSAAFYEKAAGQYTQEAETLLAFAKENKKNIVNTERAYFGVITDAIEGCFAFDLNPDEYILDVNLPKNASYKDALRKAVAMEEKIVKFYLQAAEQSGSLMADVPRAFSLIARKREPRIAKIKSML